MATDHEETLRRAFALNNARDTEAMRGLLDPEFEFAPHITGGFEGTEFHGVEAAADFQRMRDEAWETLEVETWQTREQGDTLVALGMIRGRGRASGIAVEAPTVWVCRFR